MIVSIVNQKGGSSKTTTALNLASCIQNEGPEVMLLDCDPQESLGEWVKFRNESKIGDLPFRKGAEKDPDNLRVTLEDYRKRYPFIICDGPPSAGPLTSTLIRMSDIVIIPVLTAPFDLWALKKLMKLMYTLLAGSERIPIIRFLPSRIESGTTIVDEFMEDYRNNPMKIEVMKSVIKKRVIIPKAHGVGKTIFEVTPNDKKIWDKSAIEGAIGDIESVSDELGDIWRNRKK